MTEAEATEREISSGGHPGSGYPEWLGKLQAIRCRLVLRVRSEIVLPHYKGSTLRGGFGEALRRVSCLGSRCTCRLGQPCAYTYLFESPPPEDHQLPSFNNAVPQPFVIEPPLDGKAVYAEGDTIEFHLVLIGRGIQHLPYIVVAFEELGRIGLGKGRGHYSLEAVWGVGQERDSLIFDGIRRRFVGHAVPIVMNGNAAGASHDTGQVRLRFLTPTRLREDGKLATRLDFSLLSRALYRRCAALAHFHCGAESDLDGHRLLALADQVVIAWQDLRWWDWERFSARQGCRMKLGGIVGEITYDGPIGPFLGLLQWGTLLHVGKTTSFGNGLFTLKGAAGWSP